MTGLNVLYGLAFSFIGFAFTTILMNDLLLWYKRILTMTKAIPEWLKKPLGLCSVCFTGQLSLWGSLPLVELTYSGIILWFGVVCLNMVIVYILTHKYYEAD